MNEQDEKFIQEVIATSKKNIGRGNQPFASILVKDGQIVASAQNQIHTECDPTFHAELALVREFCHQQKLLDLSGYTLYTNAEPCAMCAAALAWAKVGRLVYALSTKKLNTMWDEKIAMDSAEIFARATWKPTVTGPLLEGEATLIFDEYFNKCEEK